MELKSLGSVRWGDYSKSVLLIAAASLLGSRLEHTIAAANIVMLYILVVVITAVRWGRGPSILAAALSVLVFDVVFVPPHFSLNVAGYQYLIAFATLFIVGIVVSTLTVRARDRAEADRGIGIPAADLEQVFNKFYRVRCRSCGTRVTSGIGGRSAAKGGARCP